MKNIIVISGRLPGFEGKYTAANGDKKSMMNWAMNTQLSTKNEQGYYDEGLLNFVAFGFFADQLQQINQMSKEERKEWLSISISGRLLSGYKDKEGNIVNSASVVANEVEFIRRLPSADSGTSNGGTDKAFSPSTSKGPGMKTPTKAPGFGAGPGNFAPKLPTQKGARF